MVDNAFFNETTEQSSVKTTIVQKYFEVWAKIIMPTVKKRGEKFAYIDLFAGPGRYKSGEKSTPLLILEKAIDDPDMRNMLITIFNDKDKGNVESLTASIENLNGINKMRYYPKVTQLVVGEQIAKELEKMTIVPSLFFIDPWGYKGLSLRLIDSVLKDWGSDCIFFFNYNRISMGINNPTVKKHINVLFGQDWAGELRKILNKNPLPIEKENAIIEFLSQALSKSSRRYILPFCFKNHEGNRTSHHLIFVSKHFKGYEKMKEIMAKESSAETKVPSFTYNPADKKFPMLFDLSRNLEDLEEMLLSEFAGQSIIMQEIYEQHNVGKPDIKSNYKETLKKLEQNNRIKVEPPYNERKKGTFADHVRVEFPILRE